MKKPTISKLKKQLDQIFSLYIRKRDKKCITCGSTKNLQCGHFHSRTHLSTRWSEINCNTQCVGCNVFKSGNMAEYAHALQERYGQNILQKLYKEKEKIVKLTPDWYIEKINYYENKLNELEN
jgi:hypothetical protein